MNSNITVINQIRIEEQEDKIRIAAYCRVSTDSEDQQNSLMAQMRYYENFLADSETERLVSVYADATVIIGLKQNPTHGRRFSPVFFA